MVTFHTGMPRNPLERYIAITKKPHPIRADWWVVTLETHGEGGIVIERTDETMTPEGAKSRAEELATFHRIRDVVILDGK